MKAPVRPWVAAPARARARGQSIVELGIAIPVVLLLLLGMLEFGFAFSHHLTLEYATREGARTGAALADGLLADGSTAEVGCSTTPNVDDYIIAAVQRVLIGTGEKIPIPQVREIRIYKANSAGADTGTSNKWVPAVLADGVTGTGPSVDGVPLMFNRSGPQSWTCSTRNNGANPDSVGVSLIYDYQYITPLGNLLGIAGAAQIRISDKTVMALNPAAN